MLCLHVVTEPILLPPRCRSLCPPCPWASPAPVPGSSSTGCCACWTAAAALPLVRCRLLLRRCRHTAPKLLLLTTCLLASSHFAAPAGERLTLALASHAQLSPLFMGLPLHISKDRGGEQTAAVLGGVVRHLAADVSWRSLLGDLLQGTDEVGRVEGGQARVANAANGGSAWPTCKRAFLSISRSTWTSGTRRAVPPKHTRGAPACTTAPVSTACSPPCCWRPHPWRCCLELPAPSCRLQWRSCGALPTAWARWRRAAAWRCTVRSRSARGQRRPSGGASCRLLTMRRTRGLRSSPGLTCGSGSR